MRIPLLWRLAPATLLRFPRSAAAVAFSAAVVVVASVMGPLFLDSSERASLEAELERTGRWRAGMQILHRPVRVAAAFEDQVRLRRLGNEVQRLLEERVEGVEGLGSPIATFLGPFAVARSGDETSTVRMISRTSALANVTVVASAGEGVWIADVTADALGVEPGDRISIGSGQSFRVGGVYRALAEDRPRAYWDPLGDFIFKQTSADTIPPPFLIGSGDAYVELLARLDPSMQVRWEVPLSSEDIPPDRAASVAREIERITGETEGGSHPIGRTLLDLGGLAYDPLVTSLLPGIMSTAAERIETSRAPATVLTVAARLLGAGLMTAAGISLVSRRRSEVRALIARGVGPRALGARFLVEGVAPVALGGAAGLAAAFGGVALLGAGSGAGWPEVAALGDDAALAAAAGLGVFGLATAAAVVREERSFGARSTWLRLYARVAAAAVVAYGVVAYRSLASLAVDPEEGSLGPGVLLAPIGVIAAAALVAGALLRVVLPAAAAAARRRSIALFLALKRLGSGSGMTHALVIVCGSALGVMFFGFTVSGSVHATATAKAKTFVGSDVAAIVPPNPPPLRGVGIPATQVVIADAFFSGTSRGVTLLGIDPETFVGAAFWDEAFADQDLDALVASLNASDSGDVPVLASGLPGVGIVELAGVEVPLEIVGRAESFPGTRARQPLLAMTKDSLTRVVRAGGSYITTHQVWAKGTPETVTTALRRAGVTFYQLLTTDEVLDSPILQSLLWSLGLLGAVGALASGAALVGLSLYLQARHRAAQVATALTRRMAFPRAQELLSSVAEIGGAGAASFLVGAVTGIVTAALVNEQLDIQPALSPDPVLVLPAAIVAVTGVAVAGVAVGTAWRLQRRMDRTSVGEVMRV